MSQHKEGKRGVVRVTWRI